MAGTLADLAPPQTPQQQMLSSLAPNPSWGMRIDGKPKGNGFFGPLLRPDGDLSSELSFSFDKDGKTINAPLIVPTMDSDQLNHLLNGGDPTPDIFRTAMNHAISRVQAGQSAFAQPGEIYPLPAGYGAPQQDPQQGGQ